MKLLFTADMHLRDSVPQCRIDNFNKWQWQKVEEVKHLLQVNNAIWIDCGDIFHVAKPTLEFMSTTLSHIGTQKIYAVAGNHDLPSHNLNSVDKSGLGVLKAANIVSLLGHKPYKIKKDIYIYGCHYGAETPTPQTTGINILVIHDMFYPDKESVIPNAMGHLAKPYLRRLSGYNYVISGHNHKAFQVKIGNKELWNVGSLTRQTADQVNHEPRVLLYDTEQNKISPIKLTYSPEPLSTKHIEEVKEEQENVLAFIQSLSDVEEISLSFENNVTKVLEQSNSDKPTQHKVWEIINEQQRNL